MWLDSGLNFGSHFSKKLKKAKIVKARIIEPSKTYGLLLALVQRIQIMAIQSVILYRAEL